MKRLPRGTGAEARCGRRVGFPLQQTDSSRGPAIFTNTIYIFYQVTHQMNYLKPQTQDWNSSDVVTETIAEFKRFKL